MSKINTENNNFPTEAESEENVCPHCSGRKKKRSEKEFKNMMNRLKRIEGQIRGIERLLEEDTYCVDILTQVMAVNSAINSFSKELLANHMKTCVKNDILAGKDESIDEILAIFQKFMK